MKLINGDCLEVMDKLIAEGVVIDAIVCDPPYGTTACKWDTVIPFDEMWARLNELIKPNGVIVLFGSEPFSSLLRVSNLNNFKHDWIWNKSHGSFATAKTQPLKRHEIISIFSKEKHLYNRQMIEVIGKTRDRRTENFRKQNNKNHRESATNPNMGLNYSKEYNPSLKNPISIIKFSNPSDKRLHPTQKPVTLMEYLIKTYTNENEIVLDFTMGSGTTGVACKNLNRKFIGIELDETYFQIAEKRINKPKETLF